MDGNSIFFVLINAFGPNNQKMVWPTWIFLFEHLGHPNVAEQITITKSIEISSLVSPT